MVTLLNPPRNVEELQVSLARVSGFSIDRGRLAPSPSANFSKARSYLKSLLAPADETQLVAWIVRLWHDTAHADKVSDEDAKVIITSRVERLSAYPADIVEATLKDWPTHAKWWPDAWKDLQDALEPMTELRRALLADLDHVEAMARTPMIAPDAQADAARREQEAHAEAAEHEEVSQGLRALVVSLSDARRSGPKRKPPPANAVAKRFQERG